MCYYARFSYRLAHVAACQQRGRNRQRLARYDRQRARRRDQKRRGLLRDAAQCRERHWPIGAPGIVLRM